MYQNYYQYLQWLQNQLQMQEQRIIALEKSLKQMAEELKIVKEKPSIQVDTIEYKFDQLKVETLEGTLNIGLNPNDLQGIEDLAVNHQSLNNPVSPKEQMQRSMEIEKALLQYLDQELPLVVEQTQRNLNLPMIEAAYVSFIKEDIQKQLPSRIDFHLKAAAKNNRSNENETGSNQMIIALLKQEIQNGVAVFLKHLPKNDENKE